MNTQSQKLAATGLLPNRPFLDPRNARAVSIAEVAEGRRTQGVQAL